MKKKLLAYTFVTVCFLGVLSCDKNNEEEVTKNDEALITAFTFADPIISGQPVISDTNILCYIADSVTAADLSSLTPTITISEGAALVPASGVPQDFSQGPITYTVTAEDNIHKTIYLVSFLKTGKYDFENWVEAQNTNSNPLFVFTWEEVANGWGSSNPGLAMIKTFNNNNVGYFTGDFVVRSTSDAKGGNKAALIQTQLTKHAMLQMLTVPLITSGSLFLGKFELNMFDKLSSTKFGTPYANEPDRFRGWYKYTPGAKYYQATKDNGTTADSTVSTIDECSIFAVLYEAPTSDFVLTGKDIANSEKIILRAVLSDGTAKAGWTYFDLPFESVEGRTYDISKRDSYKLAIVCSSSKNGDSYSGAPGSTLIVDDFEIVAK